MGGGEGVGELGLSISKLLGAAAVCHYTPPGAVLGVPGPNRRKAVLIAAACPRGLEGRDAAKYVWQHRLYSSYAPIFGPCQMKLVCAKQA